MKARLCFLAFLLAAALMTVPASGGTVLYTNGPINGNTGSEPISSGIAIFYFETTDSFTLTSSATITGVTFGEWLGTGYTPQTVDWDIGTSAFDSSLGSGSSVTVTPTLFCTASVTCGSGTDDVYSSSFSLNLALGAGTYWLTLFGATDSDSSETPGWDENDGPSSAESGIFVDVGDVPSESFSIIGTSAPEPGTFVLGGAGLLLLIATRLRRAGKHFAR
ncbi:MAG: hypothetical protein ABSE57_34490 [Bryobacteraceae bacterium]|jgi:hypothetical protein